jgi:hypothetical protein
LANTPFFLRGDSLSATDSWRVAGFRARFKLGCKGETRRFFGVSRTISRAVSGRAPRFENRADSRRFPILSLLHRPVLRRGTIITIWVFFSIVTLCPSLIMGLFFNDGCVLGLSGLFRSPRIPLGISVEDHVLEIVGLDSESGLILGEFARIPVVSFMPSSPSDSFKV